MSAQHQTPALLPTVRRGFGMLPCLHCAEEGVNLNLSDLDTLYCPNCENEYTIDEVRQTVGAWQKVLAWIDLAPEAPAE